MVTHPYFTEQTIAKEQGIIGQEIKMYDDSPDWRLITGLFECLYHSHPIRSDIAGTVESIAEITPEMLYDSCRAYYVAMAPFKYQSIWEMIAIRDGGLAIYGGIIGGFLFGGLACKWRGVPVLPMFDLTAMGFLIGQGCGRWGNFFNQEAFGCNTTLPWGMYSEATRAYLMSSTVTVPKGVVIDPNLPVHPTFLYESIWCFVGFFLLFRYIKKRKFNGDITLRYLIWYGAGRFWIEGLRTDSLMLVPSIGLRVSQLVAGIAVVAGIAAEVYFTRKLKDKPLFVPLALNAENKAAQKKLDGPISFAGKDTQLLASSPRKLFLEKTEAYNAQVKAAIEQAGQKKA